VGASPDPFSFDGGPVGALLVHGFGGSPAEMRLIGWYLHARGMTVRGPLLPGHGTTLDDLNRRRWQEWVACTEGRLDELLDMCSEVYLVGLSMGALISAYMAARRPEIRGIVLYSPATWPANRLIYLTGLGKHFVPTVRKSRPSDLADPGARALLWGYDRYPVAAAHELLKLIRHTRRALPRLTCPLLVIHTASDTSIRPESAPRTFRRAGSQDKQLVLLRGSGHCLTVDAEWAQVAEMTAAFITRHARTAVHGA
jgi:carboxylesterase